MSVCPRVSYVERSSVFLLTAALPLWQRPYVTAILLLPLFWANPWLLPPICADYSPIQSGLGSEALVLVPTVEAHEEIPSPVGAAVASLPASEEVTSTHRRVGTQYPALRWLCRYLVVKVSGSQGSGATVAPFCSRPQTHPPLTIIIQLQIHQRSSHLMTDPPTKQPHQDHHHAQLRQKPNPATAPYHCSVKSKESTADMPTSVKCLTSRRSTRSIYRTPYRTPPYRTRDLHRTIPVYFGYYLGFMKNFVKINLIFDYFFCKIFVLAVYRLGFYEFFVKINLKFLLIFFCKILVNFVY